MMPVTSKVLSSTMMLLWRKSSWSSGNGPSLCLESQLAIALICDGNLSMMEIMSSAGIGPLCIMFSMVFLSHLNLTLSAQARRTPLKYQMARRYLAMGRTRRCRQRFGPPCQF